jgi:outer membrane protein OmpA-like peptidoglycan-associated protein
MAKYDGMTPGQVLADASVAEFIRDLGLGIAEAQTALDENSARQMNAFTEAREGLGSRSLLELGLMPAFYHYQHADVSVSLQIRLEVGKRDEFGFAVNADLDSDRTSSASSESAESETGSGSRVETRRAALDYRANSTGVLLVNGREVAPTGADPEARLRNLRDLLTAGDDVETVVFDRPRQELEIASDAPAELVVVTPRSVAFIGTPYANGIIAIRANEATSYVLNGDTTVEITPQADLAAYAEKVEAEIEALPGFNSKLHPPRAEDVPSFLPRFDSGKAEFRNEKERREMVELARVFAALGTRVRLEGTTDRVGSEQANVALGDSRARFVRDFLVANGVPPERITITPSKGEHHAAEAGDPDHKDNPMYRRTLIFTPGRTDYWLGVFAQGSPAPALTGVSPDLRGAAEGGNGFVFLWDVVALDLNGQQVTIDGQPFQFSPAAGGGHQEGTAETYAHNLAAAINTTDTLRASRQGHVVHVAKASQSYSVQLYTRSTSALSLTGSEGLTVVEQFTRTRTASTESRKGSTTTVAVGVTVDKREARQFNMAVTGNSQISARLVSVPPPDLFVEAIRALQAERRR